MAKAEQNSKFYTMVSKMLKKPFASAEISGGEEYSDIHGYAWFFPSEDGMIVAAEVSGLPKGTAPCGSPVFGYHIHSGGKCSGDSTDPFSDTNGHLDTDSCPHPDHSGDMPPLFGNDGYAFSAFFTDRLEPWQIIGKTVVIHLSPDDYKTQPSGNSGKRIACGVIRRF